MGLRIGGGIGPFRASLGTRGAGIGIGPVSAGGSYRRGGGNAGCGLIVLLAFVVAAIDWVAVHWFITLPIAVALTVLVIVLARRAHGRRLAAAVQAQADLAAAEARMREAVAALKPALGADYEDFMRAAQFVVSTRTTGRARLQAALGVSASRATQLQLMLENQEVISAPRGSHRDVLIPAHSAHYFELSRDTSPASA